VKTFERVGGLPKIMQLKGDWDFMLRVLADGWTIEHIPKSLMMYRDNPTGSSSLTTQRHMDIFETMAVVGRFGWALSGGRMAALHAAYFGYLLRRVAGCVVRLHGIRLLWTLPAIGCVFASFWTCLLDNRRINVVPRRVASHS
jgi:hypothetical protein